MASSLDLRMSTRGQLRYKLNDALLRRVTNMRNRISTVTLTLFLAGLLCPAHASDKKPEDLVAKHLDSIGPNDARSAIKSLAVQGALRFKILVGGFGNAVGSWGRASDQRKSNFVMRFNTDNWRGEQFIFDGSKTYFSTATQDHQYSTFAKLVSGHDFILRDGLLGGELSTAWALQNLDQTHARLHALGAKKMDGHEVEGVQYFPKSGGDMTVKIYFDVTTHQHVMTVYSVETVPHNTQNGINESAVQQQLRYTIEERFSDFKTDNGVTLPHHYDLQYTEELQTGQTRLYDWDMTVEKLDTNVNPDPSNFRPQ
jgi:hypothetical protein